MEDDQIKLCDAHVHLIDYADMEEIDQIIDRAKQAGVRFMKENATSWKTFARVLEIYKKHPDFIVPACGYHPRYLQDIKEGWYEE